MEPVNLHVFRNLRQVEELEVPSFISIIDEQLINVVILDSLKKLTLTSIEASIAAEMFNALGKARNLRDLEINYPLKYESMDLLETFLSENQNIVNLKITKFKPFNFNFLRSLCGNSKLKTLQLEIFKLNRLAPENDSFYFEGLENETLELLSIKASKHLEYCLYNKYLSSMLNMFKGLKRLEL